MPLGADGFTGRTDELSALAAILTADVGIAVPVATITGIGGIGKTALVLESARLLADRFPDGQLFVDLRGFSRSGPTAALDAVRQLLRSLGVSGADIPTTLDQAVARYRTAMARRSMLVILGQRGIRRSSGCPDSGCRAARSTGSRWSDRQDHGNFSLAACLRLMPSGCWRRRPPALRR